jgi:hypothetical protein
MVLRSCPGGTIACQDTSWACAQFECKPVHWPSLLRTPTSVSLHQPRICINSVSPHLQSRRSQTLCRQQRLMCGPLLQPCWSAGPASYRTEVWGTLGSLRGSRLASHHLWSVPIALCLSNWLCCCALALPSSRMSGHPRRPCCKSLSELDKSSRPYRHVHLPTDTASCMRLEIGRAGNCLNCYEASSSAANC